jgi:DNA (cytosine-5)-methyltransferase 1
MADGSSQSGFNFPKKALVSALRKGEIILDFFAGGGGASEALKQALGRDPDVAVNHDPWALGMHAANHPFTRHLPADVWTVDILREVLGRLVGWFHASPDCTHFSQAKGGQPRSKATRSLSWVVLKVAGTLARAGLAPRIISLENVEQILKWGPLIAKRDKATGRVIKLDGTVAAPGERVSVWEQSLVPDKKHAGRTWDQFVAALRSLGYVVEWRKLSACDYGAGTSRKRLFLIARRDGMPIVWPKPTHGDAPGLTPFVTAADCIDFDVPCPSIFLDKVEARKLGVKRPLADATLRRIARGVKRYVIDAAEPFIVTPTTHQGERRSHPGNEPLPTVTGANRGELAAVMPTLAPFVTQHAQSSVDTNKAATKPVGTMCAEVKGGHFAIVAPVVVQASHGEGKPGGVQRWGEGVKPGNSKLGVITAGGGDHALAAATLIQAGYGEREGQAPRSLDIEAPLGVATAGGIKHAVVSAFLEQANGGFYDGDGNAADRPTSSICGTGSQQRLAAVNLAKLRGTSSAADAEDPLATISAGGEHHAVIECELSPEHEAGALQVAAFLVKYYGTAFGVDIDEPLDTVTTRDRLALVTVWVKGSPYVIVDIGLRMLRREELFRAQGFPADYIIDRTADGRKLSISKSVRMVGNSVSPPPLRAIAEANLDRVPEELAVDA